MNKINSILLVDDDQINNFINKRIISNLSIANEIDIAQNGEEALKRINNYCSNTGECQELIFLDINMPVMNGFEFLEQYQHLKITNKTQVKIIILTTSTNPNDLLKLKEFTIAGYINKPLTEEKILNILNPNKNLQLEAL